MLPRLSPSDYFSVHWIMYMHVNKGEGGESGNEANCDVQ